MVRCRRKWRWSLEKPPTKEAADLKKSSKFQASGTLRYRRSEARTSNVPNEGQVLMELIAKHSHSYPSSQAIRNKFNHERALFGRVEQAQKRYEVIHSQ
jgi:hypothetical protein